MLDMDQLFHTECNTSDFATGTVLLQQAKDSKWHLCAYISKSLTPVERSYLIYNKKLLAVIQVFKAWRHYLEDAIYPVDIWTDYKNLE